MRYLKLLCTFALFFTAVTGDYLVFHALGQNHEVLKAISDVLVHGAVGFWSAIVFFCYDIQIRLFMRISLIAFCTFISMIIDIDHALKAGSLKLKDMLNLKERGIFHNTTLCLLIAAIPLVYGVVLRKASSILIGCMVLLGTLSHQLRDGNRRGLWFHPIGNTPAIDTKLYVLLLGVLANSIGFLYQIIEINLLRKELVEYDYSKLVV